MQTNFNAFKLINQFESWILHLTKECPFLCVY